MHRVRRIRRQHHERGAAAVETAFSLLILTFLLTVLFNFGHAMLVRHRLTTATSTASRVCALNDPAVAEACARQTITTQLGGIVGACQSLEIETNEADLNDIEVLGVQSTCDYIGGPWARFLATRLPNLELTLTANAVMPRR